MDAETAYRINEAKYGERLAELKSSPTLDSLTDEIALCRAMIEDALNGGKANSAPLVRDLISVLASLVKVHRQQRVEDGIVLERSALARFTAAIVQIVADELHGLPQWESVIDRITCRLSEVIERLDNKSSEQTKIETNGRRTAVRAK
jgi:hypothetical protein